MVAITLIGSSCGGERCRADRRRGENSSRRLRALPTATAGPTRAPNCTLHNGAMRNDTTALEGAVDLVVLPVTFGLRAGNLRLADGRLTFTRRRGRVVFDAPVHELHSVARSSLGTGFHLWHGPTRYRFVVHHPVLPSEYGPGGLASTVEAVDQLRRGIVTTARSRAEVDRWHDALDARDRAGPTGRHRRARAVVAVAVRRRHARRQHRRHARARRRHRGRRRRRRVSGRPATDRQTDLSRPCRSTPASCAAPR